MRGDLVAFVLPGRARVLQDRVVAGLAVELPNGARRGRAGAIHDREQDADAAHHVELLGLAVGRGVAAHVEPGAAPRGAQRDGRAVLHAAGELADRSHGAPAGSSSASQPMSRQLTPAAASPRPAHSSTLTMAPSTAAAADRSRKPSTVRKALAGSLGLVNLTAPTWPHGAARASQPMPPRPARRRSWPAPGSPLPPPSLQPPDPRARREVELGHDVAHGVHAVVVLL